MGRTTMKEGSHSFVSAFCQQRMSFPYQYQPRKHTKKRPLYCWYSSLAVVVVVVVIARALFLGMIRTRSMIDTNHSTTATTSSSTMQYQRIEQGHLDSIGRTNKNAFMKYQVIHSSTKKVVSMKQWAEFLANDYESFHTLVSSCPFDAVFWECAPTTDAAANPMEFVLVDAPELAQFARKAPDRTAFQPHFTDDNNNHSLVAVFPTLGKDALLLVPSTNSVQLFTDIAYFARHATEQQRHELYQRLSQVLLEQIINKKTPFWLSTSGMGIAWMHIRLDSRPKYYTYKPYKTVVT